MTASVHCVEYATTMKKPLTVSIIWQCPELTKTDYLGHYLVTIRQLHISIGRHASTAAQKSQRGGMSTSHNSLGYGDTGR